MATIFHFFYWFDLTGASEDILRLILYLEVNYKKKALFYGAVSLLVVKVATKIEYT